MVPFELTVPESGRTPVVVEVPHAGLGIPEAVRDETIVDALRVMRDADLYVDELYADAPARGAALLTATLSRYVVDLNRAADDIDLATVPDHPAPRGTQARGVVWRLTTDGLPALRRPLTYAELSARLARYHAPYHDALRAELLRTRERFGFAILVAGHSMPSVGRTGHADTGTRRADIVPGTRGRTSADGRIIDVVEAHFRDAGLSVRHDDPYRGGFTTAHYGRPRDGVHAVQIELNRALYVNERTGKPKTRNFARLRRLLAELVEKLGRVDPR
jgi:N-formylglutamate amidohydrolase